MSDWPPAPLPPTHTPSPAAAVTLSFEPVTPKFEFAPDETMSFDPVRSMRELAESAT